MERSSNALIWVQTVCKGYQQTTKVVVSKERVKKPNDYFRKNRVSNSLDPDQAQLIVWPNPSPNCLQRLSANDISSKEL